MRALALACALAVCTIGTRERSEADKARWRGRKGLAAQTALHKTVPAAETLLLLTPQALCEPDASSRRLRSAESGARALLTVHCSPPPACLPADRQLLAEGLVCLPELACSAPARLQSPLPSHVALCSAGMSCMQRAPSTAPLMRAQTPAARGRRPAANAQQ